MSDERLKLAVFIDFDNIEIGVKTTLGVHFDIGAILEAIKERGEVITKVAYGDWKRAGDHSRLLTQHAIRMVQRNVTPGGDKNGADINLALDALEMALTHDHINAYVIVGGDSDFISLVEKLKQYDKKVFVVGGRAFTSIIMQKNCYEFIAYENLIAPPTTRRAATPEKDRGRDGRLSKAVPLVARALQVLADREVSPQLGLLKSTLLQLDSAFSERDYGVSSFREFVEKLAQAGFVNLKQAGRSLLVELNEAESKTQVEAEPAAAVETAAQAAPVPAPAPAPQQAASAPAEP
ncbi:MAG: NYN domain-containing protein, partial [Bacteroidales bacterium]